MSTMSERSHNVFVFVVLFLILNLQTCCGKYDCYQLSPGKNICFLFDSYYRTFEGSKQFCKDKGGFLLEIHDNETQRLVQQFGNDTKLSFVEVWLNLVRTNSNMWVWGDEGSGNYLTYSSWETGNPALREANGINNAFMISNYKWKNTYEPQQPSTICMEERGASIAYSIGTPGSIVLYEAIEESTSINNTSSSTTNSTSAFTTTTGIQSYLFFSRTTFSWSNKCNLFLESGISSNYPNVTPATTTTLLVENATSTTSNSILTLATTPTTSSNSISTSATTSTTTTISWSLSSPTTTTTTSMQPAYATPAHSDSSSSSSSSTAAAALIGIGVGVGLGGLVLIIVSSLLIAKFVFHKEIPLSFKSSRNKKSPPYETGSDIIEGSYEQTNEKKLHKRSPYAEVVMSDTPNSPPNSTLTYICFKDLIQPNSASGLEGLSKTDYGTSSTQTSENMCDNAK